MSYRRKSVIAGLAGVLALAAPRAKADLVAHWQFDEGSGITTQDVSSNGNTGTLQNGLMWTNDSRSGYALQFDGIGNKVSVPYSTSIGVLPEITIEAWIKRNSESDGMVISKNGPYFLSIRDNKVEGGIFSGSSPTWLHVRGITDVGLNEWNHIAMSYDGLSLNVYLNGRQDASAPKTGDIYVTGQGLHMGWGEPGHHQYFNGIIDDVKIHNIAVPEPSTLDLIATGMFAARRRRNRRND